MSRRSALGLHFTRRDSHSCGSAPLPVACRVMPVAGHAQGASGSREAGRAMNPRVPLRALAAVAIWLLAFSLPAQAQPAPHSFFARGSLGTATMALTDWRNVIDAEKKAFEAAHVPAQWEDFATTFEPAFEVDYMM